MHVVMIVTARSLPPHSLPIKHNQAETDIGINAAETDDVTHILRMLPSIVDLASLELRLKHNVR